MSKPEPIAAAVCSNQSVNLGITQIWINAPHIVKIARPGQFIMIKCGDTLLRRPFSIHRINRSSGEVAILFCEVGAGTAWLTQRQAGEVLDVLGPLGNGFSLPEQLGHILLVGGGVGVAPLTFLGDEAFNQGHKVTFLSGARNVAQVCPSITPTGVQRVYCTDDGSFGRKGFVTEYIKHYLDAVDAIYACGPAPMFHSLAQIPGIADKSVQLSLEVRMACGIGLCNGCSIQTQNGMKKVCNDGPVFFLNDLMNNGIVTL